MFALAGDTAEAQKLAEDLNKRSPNDTIVQFNYLPVIRATLAFKRGNAQEALENLRTVSSLRADSAELPEMLRGIRQRPGLPGGASRSGGRCRVSEDSRPSRCHPVFTPAALAHLGLGRAYALAGDNAKAKAAYEDFLALWKDADPDIPIFKQAKAEYSQLQTQLQ